MASFTPVTRSILPKLSAVQEFTIKILPFWTAATLTAMVSYAFSSAFSLSEKFVSRWASFHPEYAFFVIPAGLCASFAMVHYLAPFASGSGIPQLMAALETSEKDSKFIDRLLSVRVLVVKFFATCVAVACGGIVGREGPMLQISGIVFRTTQKFWPKFKFTFESQSMILAGGAAGLASAFNTPIGGVIFAIEELAKVHISRIRTSVFHAVIIAGLLTQALMGNYIYLRRISLQQYSFQSTFFLAFASVIIGLLGAYSGILLLKASDLRAALSVRNRFFMSIVCGFLIATLLYFTNTDSLGSGRELIQKLLETPEKPMELSLGFSRMFGSLVTYAGGVAGGIFAPALSSGAALGSYLSKYVVGANPEVWILGGMVAFLTGVTRTPFTSLVLVLEMTDSHGIILDLMLAAILAQGAARLLDPISFYEHMAHRIVSNHRSQNPIEETPSEPPIKPSTETTP